MQHGDGGGWWVGLLMIVCCAAMIGVLVLAGLGVLSLR